MLTRHDVGHRVAIRRLCEPGEGRPTYSELVGKLLELTEHTSLVQTSRGTVEVPNHSIRAVRRVPDRRALTATERLEKIAAAGWPAIERARLGDWLLRAGDGWTARANSALPIGNPDLPLPEAIDAVTTWYAERGLPPAIMVPEPVGGRITPELTARGWTPAPAVLVQTARLDDVIAASATTAPQPADQTQLDPRPSQAWLAVVASAKRYPAPGSPEPAANPPAPATVSDAALRIITGVERSRFAGVYRSDGSALATARGVVADDGEWLGISLVHVDPTQRRRGLATAITRALAGWAASEGAHRAYLQVEAHNEAAIRLYAGLGFATRHRYVTWRRPT